MIEFFLPVFTLWKRELVRFFRQPSRVVGALVPPILFWVLIGSGLGDSFRPSNYLQYFFPGTIVLIVLFTAIFSTISIIEDRHEGFLQSVWVSPIPRTALVLGKILGGTTLAFLQGLLFILIAPTVGLKIPPASIPLLIGLLFLTSFALTGLGFFIAWKLDSTQGFHAIMNLLLMPMWLLSGSLFPMEGAPAWLQAVMRVNPLTYGLSGLGAIFHLNGQPLQIGIAPADKCFAAMAGFSAITFALSVFSARKNS